MQPNRPTRSPGTSAGLLTDVVDRVAVESAADQIENTLGPIEVWVNNAMASVLASFPEGP